MNFSAIADECVVGGDKGIEDESLSWISCEYPSKPNEVVAREGHYDGVAGLVVTTEFPHKLSAFREKAACRGMAIHDNFSPLLIMPSNGEISRGFSVMETEGENRLSLHTWIVTKMSAMGCRIIDIKLKYSNFTHHAPYSCQRVQC